MDTKKQTKRPLRKLNNDCLFIFKINQAEGPHQLRILPIRNTMPFPKLQTAITRRGVVKFAEAVRQQIASFVMVFELINYVAQLGPKLCKESIKLKNSTDSLDSIGRTVGQHLPDAFVFRDAQAPNDNVA